VSALARLAPQVEPQQHGGDNEDAGHHAEDRADMAASDTSPSRIRPVRPFCSPWEGY
jgi:hypothetical protein